MSEHVATATLCRRSYAGIPAGFVSILMVILTSGFVFAGEHTPHKQDCQQPRLICYQGRDLPALSPYPYLHGGQFRGPDVPQSPDPLLRYHWDNPQADDDLQVYYLRAVRVTAEPADAFENAESVTTDNANVVVKGPGSLRMDFGTESAAWLEFDSPDLNGAVTMSISEYNRPAIVNAGAQQRIKTATPVRHGNTYRLQLNDTLYEGVRFGWIHIENCRKPWHITDVRLVCQVKPTNYTGSFSCSDPMLTRIWYTGAYGVKLNLLQDYFGAILMERSDRHSWTGDAHTSQAASLAAFGNFDFVRHNTERTANESNNIESYSMYWILSLLDYYWYTADIDTLRKYISNVEAKLAHGLEIYPTNARLGFYGHDERIGATFENPDCAENQHAYRMLFIQTCRKFAKAMATLGHKDLQQKYNRIAEQKINQLISNPEWYETFGIHACADAINAGFVSDRQQQAIFAQAFADPVQRISYSPFNQYFIIKALAQMGRFDQALASIHRCWGGQINLGATSFWEVFRPEWREFLHKNDPVPNCQTGYTSLCHPWGGGVTAWLSEEVLGIKPLKPGFAEYEIVPHLGRTLTWVKGQVLTPHGPIQAHFDISEGIATIQTPAGTTGLVGIPKVERIIRQIRINGSVVWDGKFHSVSGIDAAKQDNEFVYLHLVEPGTCRVKFSYRGRTPPPQQEKITYAAKCVGEDENTAGNWQGSYGSDGCILFNYRQAGSHIEHLPDYVAFCDWRKHQGAGSAADLQWSPLTADPRAPVSGVNSGFIRGAGALSTRNPIACCQTIAVDIVLRREQPYQVALYFVDWDGQDRQLAVEMFNYQNRRLICPVRKVSDFTGGKYLVYRYDKSARFRINHIRGGNAVLSAIFFDPCK